MSTICLHTALLFRLVWCVCVCVCVCVSVCGKRQGFALCISMHFYTFCQWTHISSCLCACADPGHCQIQVTCCLIIRAKTTQYSKAEKSKSTCQTLPAAAHKCRFVWFLRKWKALRLREDQHFLNVLFPTTYNVSFLSDIFILPVFDIFFN